MKYAFSKEEYLSLRFRYIGICLTCGEKRNGIEPDARQYECKECGEKQVYGIEEALLDGVIEITACPKRNEGR